MIGSLKSVNLNKVVKLESMSSSNQIKSYDFIEHKEVQ